MSSDWCTIESDPGVFTELVEKYGVKGIQFTEIYDYSEDGIDCIINEYGNILGIIFLFKFTDSSKNSFSSQPIEAPLNMFYAHQVINNACATQAILSIILNRTDIEIGPHLEEFKNFSYSFDPMTKGLVIGNSEILRVAHNSFRPISSLEITENDSKDSKGDAFHYICYVPFRNSVYELDGLAPGVVKLADFNNNSTNSLNQEISALYNNPKYWVSIAINEVKRRIELYNDGSSQSEIRFSLMAVVPDKIIAIEKEILELKRIKKACFVKLISLTENSEISDNDLFDDDIEFEDIEFLISTIPDNVQEIKAEIKKINKNISYNLSILQNEKVIRDGWKKENERRRHDFLPFILTILKHASIKGLLIEKIPQKNN